MHTVFFQKQHSWRLGGKWFKLVKKLSNCLVCTYLVYDVSFKSLEEERWLNKHMWLVVIFVRTYSCLKIHKHKDLSFLTQKKCEPSSDTKLYDRSGEMAMWHCGREITEQTKLSGIPICTQHYFI